MIHTSVVIKGCYRSLGGMKVGGLVFGHRAIEANACGSRSHPFPVWMRLLLLETCVPEPYPSFKREASDAASHYDRQVRMFGNVGQQSFGK